MEADAQSKQVNIPLPPLRKGRLFYALSWEKHSAFKELFTFLFSFAWNLKMTMFKKLSGQTKRGQNTTVLPSKSGRSAGIWTPGLLVPNQARYHLRYTPKGTVGRWNLRDSFYIIMIQWLLVKNKSHCSGKMNSTPAGCLWKTDKRSTVKKNNENCQAIKCTKKTKRFCANTWKCKKVKRGELTFLTRKSIVVFGFNKLFIFRERRNGAPFHALPCKAWWDLNRSRGIST